MGSLWAALLTEYAIAKFVADRSIAIFTRRLGGAALTTYHHCAVAALSGWRAQEPSTAVYAWWATLYAWWALPKSRAKAKLWMANLP